MITIIICYYDWLTIAIGFRRWQCSVINLSRRCAKLSWPMRRLNITILYWHMIVSIFFLYFVPQNWQEKHRADEGEITAQTHQFEGIYGSKHFFIPWVEFKCNFPIGYCSLSFKLFCISLVDLWTTICSNSLETIQSKAYTDRYRTEGCIRNIYWFLEVVNRNLTIYSASCKWLQGRWYEMSEADYIAK